MKFKNTLKGLARLALIPIVVGSCKYASHSEYEYAGKIGNDSVKFSCNLYWKHHSNRPNKQYKDNRLVVKKEDGRHITYIDREKNNLKIESVEIVELDGKEHCYYMGSRIGDPIVKKAQKQFDKYLDKILAEKRYKEHKILQDEATRRKQEEADILKKINEGDRLIYQ